MFNSNVTEQKITQMFHSKKISSKQVATLAIIIVVLLTFIIRGLVILASNNRNNNSNGNTDTTITPTPTSLAQCEYNGIKYENGESFDKGDSCNSCSCENGIVRCEEKVCQKEYSFELNRDTFSTNFLKYIIKFSSSEIIESKFSQENQKLEIYNNKFIMSFFVPPDSSGVANDFNIPFIKIATTNLGIELFRLKNLSSEDFFLNFENEYFYSDYYYEENQCTGFIGATSCNTFNFYYKNSLSKSIVLNVFCGVRDNTEIGICDNIIKDLKLEL